jgi:hypothetical protein
VLAFHAAVALFALLVVARNARRALGLFRPGTAGEARAAAVVPLLACAAAGTVLAVAVKRLFEILSHPNWR